MGFRKTIIKVKKFCFDIRLYSQKGYQERTIFYIGWVNDGYFYGLNIQIIGLCFDFYMDRIVKEGNK